MRKLCLSLGVLFLVGTACADEAEVVATQPPAATATAGVNDHGTETFTSENFEVELELDDFYFEPTFIKAPGESTAMMRLHNEGDAQHTFTIDDLEVDETIEPGATKEITVELGTETRYEFYCRFHGDQGMRGAFQPH